MKVFRFITLALSVLTAVVITSCGDDDEEIKKSDDPRVRKLYIDEFSDFTFVINDVEGIIFNIDSLPYKTNLDSVVPRLYGYTSAALGIFFSHPGTDTMSVYGSSAANSYMNLSEPATIVTVSEDGKHRKTYKLELRVHKYDVDAFEWSKETTLDVKGNILSQRSITCDGTYYWFCRTDVEQVVFVSSADGSKWTKKKVSGADLSFASLCNIDDALYCLNESGDVLTATFTDLAFETTSFGSPVSTLLYVIDRKVWYLSGAEVHSYSPITKKDSTLSTLPSDLKTDSIVPFVAASGYTNLGYIYSITDVATQVWAMDRYGNAEKLGISGIDIPQLDKPIVFNYDKTIAIIGGYDKDGKLSRKCYASTDSGLSWTTDWHKDFTTQVGALANAGIFVISDRGELLLVGGEAEKGTSTTVWSGRLRKIIQEEDFLNTLGK